MALASSKIEIIERGVAIQIPKNFLSRPLNDDIQDDVAELPAESPASFAASLAITLRDQLPFLGVPTIPQAAEISGTSPRTLQRLLGADGLTYQRLLDRIRFRIARQRLAEEPGLSTRELAAELFYASPSSFVRSFRRIAGVTPGQFVSEQAG